MCWSCFKEYTDEPVVNDKVIQVKRLISNHQGEASSSRLLHIHVADMNLDDHWFDEKPKRYQESEQWERDIFDALAELTEAERATALAMEWGYLDEQGNRV